MKNISKRFSLVLMLIISLFSLMLGTSCSSWAEEKYVFQGENGTYATLTVNFDAGTYTYEGNGFYSSSMGYMLREGTSYKVSSTISYVKEVNNEKYYNFHHHPWNNDYYFVLSEDGRIISSGIMGRYKFHKQ